MRVHLDLLGRLHLLLGGFAVHQRVFLSRSWRPAPGRPSRSVDGRSGRSGWRRDPCGLRHRVHRRRTGVGSPLAERSTGDGRAGRLGALVLAVPNLVVVPFGTALSLYAFWVLLNDDARQRIWPAAEDAAGARPIRKRFRMTTPGAPQRRAVAPARWRSWPTSVVSLPASSILSVEKEDRFVRFHAMQSTVTFLIAVLVAHLALDRGAGAWEGPVRAVSDGRRGALGLS